jgi:hypothetical protein
MLKALATARSILSDWHGSVCSGSHTFILTEFLQIPVYLSIECVSDIYPAEAQKTRKSYDPFVYSSFSLWN